MARVICLSAYQVREYISMYYTTFKAPCYADSVLCLPSHPTRAPATCIDQSTKSESCYCIFLFFIYYLIFFFFFVNFFVFLFIYILYFIIIFLATIVTGPILPKPAKPLPADLETFMVNAGDDGVIIVAFGSMLSVLPKPTLDMLTKVLGGMKQKVLWKLKGLLNPFLIQNYTYLVS